MYKIIIDKQIMELYKQYYFSKYPNRRKFPLQTKAGNDKIIWESINDWMVLNRIPMNKLKQDWKEFTVWLVNHYNLQDLKLKNVSITYTFYFSSNRKQDLDNRSPKFINDGFVEAGLLEDDNCFCVNTIVLKFGGVDKLNTRVEITIEEVQ